MVSKLFFFCSRLTWDKHRIQYWLMVPFLTHSSIPDVFQQIESIARVDFSWSMLALIHQFNFILQTIPQSLGQGTSGRQRCQCLNTWRKEIWNIKHQRQSHFRIPHNFDWVANFLKQQNYVSGLLPKCGKWVLLLKNPASKLPLVPLELNFVYPLYPLHSSHSN